MKQFIALSIIALFLFAFTSCTSQLEKDAKKMAELYCESTKLMENMSDGNKETEEKINELYKETEKFGKELEEKYKDEADQEEFKKLYEKFIEECE